jgi:hypothetical protein
MNYYQTNSLRTVLFQRIELSQMGNICFNIFPNAITFEAIPMAVTCLVQMTPSHISLRARDIFQPSFDPRPKCFNMVCGNTSLWVNII